jgi:hypothetical protein
MENMKQEAKVKRIQLNKSFSISYLLFANDALNFGNNSNSETKALDKVL